MTIGRGSSPSNAASTSPRAAVVGGARRPAGKRRRLGAASTSSRASESAGGIRSGRANLAGGERDEPEDREEQDELLHHVVTLAPRSRRVGTKCVTFPPEVSGHLVGSAAFKAAGTGDPRPAGSIPVHLRHLTRCFRRRGTCCVHTECRSNQIP